MDSIPYDDVLFTCALGGCLVAMGVPEKTVLRQGMLDHDYFIEFWPSIREVSTHCRLCVALKGSRCAVIELSILDLIVHLNDSHHLNRDEIADIVRPFDEAVAQPFTPYRVALSPLYATPDYATPGMVTFSAAEMKALKTWDEAAYLADMKRLADEDADMSTVVYWGELPTMLGGAKAAESSNRTAAGVEIARLYAEMRQRIIARDQLDFLKFTPTPQFLITKPATADNPREYELTWPLKAELVT